MFCDKWGVPHLPYLIPGLTPNPFSWMGGTEPQSAGAVAPRSRRAGDRGPRGMSSGSPGLAPAPPPRGTRESGGAPRKGALSGPPLPSEGALLGPLLSGLPGLDPAPPPRGTGEAGARPGPPAGGPAPSVMWKFRTMSFLAPPSGGGQTVPAPGMRVSGRGVPTGGRARGRGREERGRHTE